MVIQCTNYSWLRIEIIKLHNPFILTSIIYLPIFFVICLFLQIIINNFLPSSLLIISFQIKYWQNGKDPEADSLILLKRGLENWGLIVGLQPNTEYYVAVMAYNDAGSGVESEPFLARTFKAGKIFYIDSSA